MALDSGSPVASHIAKVRFLRSFDSDLARVAHDSLTDHQLVVPDPWNLPRSEFEAVLETIEKSVHGLIATL